MNRPFTLALALLLTTSCGADAPTGNHNGITSNQTTNADANADANQNVNADTNQEEIPVLDAPSSITASTDRSDLVHISWSPVDDATGYEVLRDDQPIARLDPTSLEYLDSDAASPDPLSAPTNLQATDDRSDGVLLTWDFSPPAPGTTHQYRVRAFLDDSPGALSAPATGQRAAYPVRLELRRAGDNAPSDDWIPIDALNSYLDSDAPFGALLAPGNVRTSKGSHLDRIFLEIIGLESLPGAPLTYELRARDDHHPATLSNPTSGRRAAGIPPLQWERSSGESPDDFSDLPGATSSPHSDLTAPTDGSLRHYRARLEVPGQTVEYTAPDFGYRALDCPVDQSFLGQKDWLETNENRSIELSTTPPPGDANIAALWSATLPASNWDNPQTLSPGIAISNATVFATTFRENRHFYIQDEHSAFQVYLDEALPQTIRMGQKVSFIATETAVFNGNPQITALTNFVIESEDNPVFFLDLRTETLDDLHYYQLVRLGGQLSDSTPCQGNYDCYQLTYGPATNPQSVSLRTSSPYAANDACLTYFGPVIGYPGPLSTLDDDPAPRLQTDSFQWLRW